MDKNVTFVNAKKYNDALSRTHATTYQSVQNEWSKTSQNLNDMLKKINIDTLHIPKELLDVCIMFNENFDITVNEENVEINNEYELPPDLIKLVSEKILTVFKTYKTNTIKAEYSSFSKNIEKVIDIYKYYHMITEPDTLVTGANTLLDIAKQTLEEPKEAKEPEGEETYNYLFTGSGFKAPIIKKIISKAEQSYKTQAQIRTMDKYITQFIKQFINYNNDQNDKGLGLPPSINLKSFTFKPTIRGGRKLYHRKRKSSRKKKSRRNIKSTKRIKRHSKRRHSKKK